MAERIVATFSDVASVARALASLRASGLDPSRVGVVARERAASYPEPSGAALEGGDPAAMLPPGVTVVTIPAAAAEQLGDMWDEYAFPPPLVSRFRSGIHQGRVFLSAEAPSGLRSTLEILRASGAEDLAYSANLPGDPQVLPSNPPKRPIWQWDEQHGTGGEAAGGATGTPTEGTAHA